MVVIVLRGMYEGFWLPGVKLTGQDMLPAGRGDSGSTGERPTQ